jgi:hypothetical protein
MTDNDDEQPTGMDGEIDTTAAVPVSPRTVAAERDSEPPTTIVRDVGLALGFLLSAPG